MAVRLIAEFGSVHDGSFGNARKLIEAAASSGADVVKFQTHVAEAESLPDAPAPPYFADEPRRDYFRRTAFTADQWHDLRAHAAACGTEFLSSPFSIEAVDMLEQVGVSSYKVASGEVTNLPLLERIAATGKPVYLSSGMSSWQELDLAVDTLLTGGPVTVLQCSSVYPCPPDRVGLNVIAEMVERYRLPVGFSDHTMGTTAAVGAVISGAVVVEKHFTFSRLMYGSDARHSMEPSEFSDLACALREADVMRSNPVDKDDLTPYAEMKRIFEKSVVTGRPVTGGTVLDRGDLAFKKPGTGIPASRYRSLIGRRVARDLPADHLLTEADLA